MTGQQLQKINVDENALIEKPQLTPQQFQALSDIPPEMEWLANIDSEQTKRAYLSDIRQFLEYTNIEWYEMRHITRAHVIAWRNNLKQAQLAPATSRRKLAALASLFDYLCDKNAVTHNPVDGVKRPRKESNTGKTPALADDQARTLLGAPDPDTLKGKRDRAILSVLLYGGLRRSELCNLRVRDLRQNQGRVYFRIRGKGGKEREIIAHSIAIETIQAYLEASGQGDDLEGALFRPVKNNRGGGLNRPMTPDAIYKMVEYYAKKSEIYFSELSPHVMRSTAATKALDNNSDITKVQEWLGHSDISTTRIYDKRKSRPEDSPTNKVGY